MRDLREISSDCVTVRERKAYKSIVLCSSGLCKSNDVNYSCIGVVLAENDEFDCRSKDMRRGNEASYEVTV